MGSPVAGGPVQGAAEGQGAAGQEAGQQPQGPDFAPVIDRLDRFETQMGPVLEFVQGQQQAAEQQGQPQSYEDFVAALFAGDAGQQEPGGGAQVLPDQQQAQLPQVFQDPQAFTQLLDRALERRMDETVTPELQSLRAERQDREVSALLERYPKLQEREVAQEVTMAAQQFSHELAQRLGQPELADQLWRVPGVVENMYLAQQTRQRSDAEVPADASAGEARLEGGGAHPGAENQPGLAQQIIQAHNGNGSGFRWS